VWLTESHEHRPWEGAQRSLDSLERAWWQERPTFASIKPTSNSLQPVIDLLQRAVDLQRTAVDRVQPSFDFLRPTMISCSRRSTC
jgi:hypothetical protein